MNPKIKEIKTWLSEKYPKEGECKIEEGGNKGKRRDEVTELDISKETLKKLEISLKGSLGVEELKGFINLQTLICSSHQINSLDISKCSKLKELECDNNQLTSLNVKGLDELEIIKCSNNGIVELDLSSNIKIKKLSCHNNPLEKIIGLEKSRKSLTFINSNSFPFLDNELGENIDKAKGLLNEYEDLMKRKNISYQRIMDTRTTDLFNKTERDESEKIKNGYVNQILEIKKLTDNKWK